MLTVLTYSILHHIRTCYDIWNMSLPHAVWCKWDSCLDTSELWNCCAIVANDTRSYPAGFLFLSRAHRTDVESAGLCAKDLAHAHGTWHPRVRVLMLSTETLWVKWRALVDRLQTLSDMREAARSKQE